MFELLLCSSIEPTNLNFHVLPRLGETWLAVGLHSKYDGDGIKEFGRPFGKSHSSRSELGNNAEHVPFVVSGHFDLPRHFRIDDA